MTDTPSTEVVPVDPNNVLALPTEDEWGGVDDGWMGETAQQSAPMVPLLNFNAKPDQGFTDELTGEKIGRDGKIKVVWLAWSESRAYWKAEFGKGDKAPTCRSTNMLAPDEGSTEKQSPRCSTCPMKEWGSDGTPPQCGVRFSVMLYLPDQQRITRTSFAGLAMKHVQRYLGGFKTRLPVRPPMASITEITVAVETTPNGDFLVPNFRVVGDITRAEAAPLIALRDDLEKQWKQLASDDLNQQESPAPKYGPANDPFPSDDDVIDVDSEEVPQNLKDAFGGGDVPPLPEEEDF